MHVDIASAIDALKRPETEHQQLNIPRKVDLIRKRCVEMIKRTTRFRRKPATHIFVLMISSEVRNKKPYALSVQCIPCAGFKGSDLRQIVNNLLREMVAHKMKVAGTCKLSCLGNLLLEKDLLHPSSSLSLLSISLSLSLSFSTYIQYMYMYAYTHRFCQ